MRWRRDKFDEKFVKYFHKYLLNAQAKGNKQLEP